MGKGAREVDAKSARALKLSLGSSAHAVIFSFYPRLAHLLPSLGRPPDTAMGRILGFVSCVKSSSDGAQPHAEDEMMDKMDEGVKPAFV